jgi:hypothetical protein
MAIFSNSVLTTVTTTTAASWDLKAAAGSKPAVMEIGAINAAATACVYGYGRSGNTPTQTTPVLVQSESDPTMTGLTGCAVAWSVAPTVPPVMFRRAYLPATIGAGMIWTFPRGLILIAAAASLVQWNVGTSSANVAVHCVVDE